MSISDLKHKYFSLTSHHWDQGLARASHTVLATLSIFYTALLVFRFINKQFTRHYRDEMRQSGMNTE